MESMTVGEFKERLNAFPDDFFLEFSCLSFYRLKQRGENMIQVEFNEIIYRDDSGKLHAMDP